LNKTSRGIDKIKVINRDTTS